MKHIIFVISQPRSGSTLLQSLLSNNAAVASVSEPWLLLPFLSARKPELHCAAYNEKLAARGLEEFIPKVGGDAAYYTAMRHFAEQLYFYNAAPQVRYFLDKTPRYYEILPEIAQVFPQAKIILLKRNPLAVLHSIIDSFRCDNLDRLYTARRDFLNAPFLIQNFAQQQSQQTNVRTILYENLVTQPEIIVKELYEWLELPFEKSILHYADNDKIKGNMGDAIGIHRHQQPSADSLDTWKIKLKNTQWRSFFKGYAHYLGNDFLKQYGNYEQAADTLKSSYSFNRFLKTAQKNETLTAFSTKYFIRKYIYLLSGIDLFKK